MNVNKLKYLLIYACCFVTALYSTAQCMEDNSKRCDLDLMSGEHPTLDDIKQESLNAVKGEIGPRESPGWRLHDKDIQYAGLSIDGGGIRALVTIKVLEEIENQLDKLNKDENGKEAPQIHLCEVFDYMGGTSIGGIIALTLAYPYKDDQYCPLSTWLERFYDARKDAFPKSYINYFSQFIWGSRYSPNKYEAHLRDWFKDHKLRDLKTDVVITTTELETQKPYLFTREDAIKDGQNFFLRDVARATTAVASQYPAYKISSPPLTSYLVDGGICFNNTSQFVFNRIFKKFSKKERDHSDKRDPASHKNVFILSLGGDILISDTNKDAGKLWLAPNVVNHFCGGANSGVHREMQGLLNNPDFPENKHYVRIVPTTDIYKISYDDTSKDTLKKLENAAKVLLKEEEVTIQRIVRVLFDIKKNRDVCVV